MSEGQPHVVTGAGRMLRNRYFWTVLVLVIAAGGAAVAFTRRPQAENARPVDPGLAVVRALFLLERSPHKMSDEQVREIVPLLKVMRDMGPADELANRAIAAHIRSILTPAQRAFLDEARRRAATSQAAGQRPGDVAGQRARPGGQPGGQPGQGQAVPRGPAARERLFDRLIEMLEAGG